MARQCIFCSNIADSKEHVWPLWILNMKKDKSWRPIRRTIGDSPTKITDGVEVEARTVCVTCNNGWMSGLESQNKALIGCLLQDISTSLDASQQSLLALWTL